MSLIDECATTNLHDRWICQVDDALHSQKVQVFLTILRLFHRDPRNCVTIEVRYDQLLL